MIKIIMDTQEKKVVKVENFVLDKNYIVSDYTDFINKYNI